MKNQAFAWTPITTALTGFLVSLLVLSNLPDAAVPIAACCAVFCGAAVFFMAQFYFIQKKLWLSVSFAVLLVCAVLGWYRFNLKPIDHFLDQSCEIEGVVTELPEEVSSGKRILLQSEKITLEDQTTEAKNGIVLYYQGEKALQIGDKVRFTAKLRETSDHQKYSENSGFPFVVSLYQGQELEAVSPSSRSIYYYIANLREEFSRRVNRVLPEDVATMVNAVTLGDKSGFDAHTYFIFRATGMLHAVAVSGMHISMLLAAITILFRFLRLPKKLSACFMIVLTIFFVLLVGGSPSALRAGIMGIILAMGMIFRRERESVYTLLLATAMICILKPYYINHLGLQLSFASTLGILLWGRQLSAYLIKGLERIHLSHAVTRFFAENIAISILGTLSAAPLVGAAFGEISLLSIVVTPLCGIAISALFILGILLMILGSIPFLTPILAFFTTVCSRYMMVLIEWFAKLPFALIPVTYYFVPLALALGGLAYFIMRHQGNKKWVISLGAMVLCLTIACASYKPFEALFHPKSTLLFAAVDVGQGDAIVLQNGNSAVVIDAGGNNLSAGDTLSRFLRSRGVTHLKALILTHGHKDHTIGVETLLENFDTEGIWFPESAITEEPIQNMITQAEKKQIAYYPIKETVTLQNSAQATFTMYGNISAEQSLRKGNEICMPVMVEFLHSKLLITGDLEGKSEKLFTEIEQIQADLLKVGHHGSKKATGEEFLKEVNPLVAVISVGENSYGHPAENTLTKLKQYTNYIFRTDKEGTVELLTKGNGKFTSLN